MSQAHERTWQPQDETTSSPVESAAWPGESAKVDELLYSPVRAGKEHLGYLIVLAYSSSDGAARAASTLIATTLVRHYFDGNADATANLRSALASAEEAARTLGRGRVPGTIPGVIAISVVGYQAFIICRGAGYVLQARGNHLDRPMLFNRQKAIDVAPGDHLFIGEGTPLGAQDLQRIPAQGRGDLLAAAHELSPEKQHAVLAIGLRQSTRPLGSPQARSAWLRWASVALMLIAVFAIGYAFFNRPDNRSPQTADTQQLSSTLSGGIGEPNSTRRSAPPTTTLISTITLAPTNAPVPTNSPAPTQPPARTNSPRTSVPGKPTEESAPTLTFTVISTSSEAATDTPLTTATITDSIAITITTVTNTSVATATETATAKATPVATATVSRTNVITVTPTTEVRHTFDGNIIINGLPAPQDTTVVTQESTVTFQARGFQDNEQVSIWITTSENNVIPLLETKSDADGIVTWTWKVPSPVVSGRWAMTAGSARLYVLIRFKVAAQDGS